MVMERFDKMDTRCSLTPSQLGQADEIAILLRLAARGSINM